MWTSTLTQKLQAARFVELSRADRITSILSFIVGLLLLFRRTMETIFEVWPGVTWWSSNLLAPCCSQSYSVGQLDKETVGSDAVLFETLSRTRRVFCSALYVSCIRVLTAATPASIQADLAGNAMTWVLQILPFRILVSCYSCIYRGSEDYHDFIGCWMRDWFEAIQLVRSCVGVLG